MAGRASRLPRRRRRTDARPRDRSRGSRSLAAGSSPFQRSSPLEGSKARRRASGEAAMKSRLPAVRTDLLGGGRPDYARIESDAQLAGRLLNDYKLDPAVMKQVDEVYGPLDWAIPRHPRHLLGMDGEEVVHRSKTSLPCDRMVYQAMSDTFFRGQVAYQPGVDAYDALPYHAIFPNVMKSFDYATTKHPHEETVRGAQVHSCKTPSTCSMS